MRMEDEIRELAAHESAPGCAVTFYYQPSTPKDQSHREEAILVKDLARSALRNAEKNGRNNCARQDLERIAAIADQLHGNGGRAKAIFADAEHGFWREFDLPPILERTRIIVNRRFHLRPLMPALNQQIRLCACSVEVKRARLFLLEGDELRELVDFFNNIPRLGESDGFAGYEAGHKERHHEELIKRHFRQISETLLTTFERQGWDVLALGCRDEHWSVMQEVLHPYLKQRLIGRFLPTGISREAELKAQLTKLLDDWEQQHLDEVKEVVLNDAHRAGKGAVGLRHVLRSLEKGEIQCLLVGDQFKGSGGVCSNCGHIDLKKAGECSLCGQKLQEVEEIADAVLGAALRQNVEVMFVKDDPELAKVGHIAAQLRFRAEQGTVLQAAS
ncbi:MAG TPA: hypothetical protein VMU24_09115 [Candidatus Acidoferrales bacterium]|nr:hypothetical protein [Candidatus Acidoferrales bacterium]